MSDLLYLVVALSDGCCPKVHEAIRSLQQIILESIAYPYKKNLRLLKWKKYLTLEKQ